MKDEDKIQLDKEAAVKLGIERRMGLMRDGLKMYGVSISGEKKLISESKDHESLWSDTGNALKDMPMPVDKADEYLNNWKRERADFINYKKDEAKRIEEFARFANEDVVLEAIEVVDDLELAAQEYKGIGLEPIIKKFKDLFKKYGVEEIAVSGEKFNPEHHEAVETEAGGEKMVQVRAGYTMHGKVIRPARVKIIK